MGALEQVTQLRNQGIADEQIVAQLQQQGVAPQQIQDALGQANIKNAIGGAPQGDQMQASITEGGQQPPQEFAEAPMNAMPSGGGDPSQQTQYGEEYYPQEGYSDGGGGYDSQTFVEIAEQAFAEKVKPVEIQLSKLNEFMNLTKIKRENIDERLKRIEKSFDKLQMEILEKIGSYGSNLSSIKDEMEMMQDSFSKVVKHKVSSRKK